MVKLLGCIWKVLVPVQYMIWPPTVPEWEELVSKTDNEEEMSVKRPRMKGWERDGVGGGDWWWSALSVCEIGVVWMCLMS